MKMAEKSVLIKKEPPVCYLILNRPKIMNALNQDITEALKLALDDVHRDPSIKAVVLEGAGGNFSSGADFALFDENYSAPEWLDGMRQLSHLIRQIREIPQPVITKLRGVAYGGGANLALASDFVIATHEAQFCESFIHIGAVLDSGGTYFLPRLVGLVKAREIAMLGEPIDGKTAAEMGLIYKSVTNEELDGETVQLAEQLSQKPAAAMSLIKDGLNKSFGMSLKEALDWEAAHQAIMLRSSEHKEIVKLFLKARKK
jgi:2-(1,2-epoxy-1,2-dihydrophenyl)acetyl-CoA isomerase